MSGFLLMRDRTAQNAFGANEQLINTNLLKELLDSEVSLKTATSDILLRSIENNINKLQEQGENFTNTYAAVNSAYQRWIDYKTAKWQLTNRVLWFTMGFNALFSLMSKSKIASAATVSGVSLSLLMSALMTGSWLFYLLYGIIYAALYPLILKLALDNDETVQSLIKIISSDVPAVSAPGPMPNTEITDLSMRISAYEEFANRLVDNTSTSMSTQAVIDMIIANVNDDNQHDFYSLLFTNKQYFLSIIYLLKYGFINANDITKFISMQLNESRSNYIIKMLKANRYDVIVPFMNAISELTSVNVQNEINLIDEIESTAVAAQEITENTASNTLANNVIVGATRYNPQSLFSTLSLDDMDYSTKSYITEFNYYDEFTANNLSDVPNYLDNTSTIGYILDRLVNSKDIRLLPDRVDKIRISDKTQHISAYELICGMLNQPYYDQVTAKFNRRSLANPTKINTSLISEDLRKVLQTSLGDNSSGGEAYLSTVVRNIYGNYTDIEELPFLEFTGRDTLTRAAKAIVNKIIQTDFITADSTLWSSQQFMGAWLVNRDVENTSGLSNYFTNDVADLLKANMSIVGAGTIGNYYGFAYKEENDIDSPAYKVETLGSFLDVKSTIQSISNILDLISPYIDYDGTPSAIIASYNYWISKYLLQDGNSEESALSIDAMPIDHMIAVMLFYDILSSYWYYLQFGETLFEMVSGSVAIHDRDQYYMRFPEQVNVYFRDNSLRWKDPLSTKKTEKPLRHPVSGEVLYHHELLTVYIEQTEDQIYYGNKVYYDAPKVIEQTRTIENHVDVITTTIVHICAKVVKVVAEIVNWLFGWIPGVKKAMETIIEFTEEIQKYEITRTEIHDESREYELEEIDTFVDAHVKPDGSADYDNLSPYVWQNLLLADAQIIDNSYRANETNLGPYEALVRTQSAQEAMNATTGELNSGGAGKSLNFTPMFKINWYEAGPRVYVSYDDYLEAGGVELDDEERAKYEARFKGENPNQIGYAWAGDQIKDRDVYEGVRSFVPTIDAIALYNNQLVANPEDTEPEYVQSASITGSASKVKAYYLQSQETVWKYYKQRIAYDGEYVKYFESTEALGEYGKRFVPTTDTYAIYEFSTGKRVVKDYYRVVPASEFLAQELASDRGEFIIGRDFFVNFNLTLSSSANKNLLDSAGELNRKLQWRKGPDYYIYIPLNVIAGTKITSDYYIINTDTSGAVTNKKVIGDTAKFDAKNQYAEAIDIFEADTAGTYILNENNQYVLCNKKDNERIKFDNDKALDLCTKFTKKEKELGVLFVGKQMEGYTSGNYRNFFKKAIDNDDFHPVVSQEFYKFYQLLYYLRHSILDLPEYVNVIKTTKQWKEFELALHMSNIGKKEEQPW